MQLDSTHLKFEVKYYIFKVLLFLFFCKYINYTKQIIFIRIKTIFCTIVKIFTKQSKHFNDLYDRFSIKKSFTYGTYT